MTWERNQNLYYLCGINSFEDYVHIRKMIWSRKSLSEVANGAAYIRIPAGIGLFTEVIIFGDVFGDMPSVDMPCIDEDVTEMTFELFEMEFPYQQSNKYKWLHYYIQDMIRCCEYCRRVICRDTN